eukprot:scaffold7977_cov77-Cyclotella_meneghiniana.AAC.1
MRLEPPRAIRRNLSATSNGKSSRKQDECIQSKRSRTFSSSMPTEPSPKESCSPYKVAEKISIIQTMMVQESSTYMTSHYLHRAAVTAEERAWLCQWGFDILDACEINRTIAVIAIGYFDRYLSNRGLECVEVCLSNQRDFQLAFITCLVIALKGRGSMEVRPTFVAETMCEDMYSPSEIMNMELQILRTLGWYLNGPTPRDFLEHFMELLPTDANTETASDFLKAAIRKAEASVLDYELALEAPSSLAVASITSLMNNLDPKKQIDLGAVGWMDRIGFVMGVALGSTQNDLNVDNEDILLLSQSI